jgi:histidine triad (HIT) family protein
MAETIFSKIIRKEIPAAIVYESDTVLAFKDINPQAPVHILIIPKEPIAYITEIDGTKHAALLGELFDVANKLAREQNIDKSGFRLVINCGDDGGQEVPHLHMHLLGGRHMKWPPG